MNKEYYENLVTSENSMDGYRVFREFLETILNDDSEELSARQKASQVLNLISQSRLFLVDKKMKYLFLNTDAPAINEELKMPFPAIFVSAVFKDEDNIIMGLNVKEKPNNYCNIIALIYNVSSDEFEFFEANLNLIDGSFERLNPNGRKLKKYTTKSFILNLLLFLNEPRVVTYILNTNPKRREKKGLIPIPSQLITKITPELQEYINISYESHSKLGYAYDVRGHWRVFRDERYINKKGQKIWIAPFQRGEGLKPPQIFSICEK